jgi:hypothetical protein
MDAKECKDTFSPGEYADLSPIEIKLQLEVAIGKEWLLAKKNWLKEDSRALLEGKGFTIIGEKDDLFYKVEHPEGWHRETEGYHMKVINATGTQIFDQFCKLAPWDKQAKIEEIVIKK